MDLKEAKALLRLKAKMDVEGGGSVFSRVALEWEVWKIPTALREQAEQEMREGAQQRLAQDKLTATPKTAPADLAIKREGEDQSDWTAAVEAFHKYEQSQTRTEVVERLNGFISAANNWVNSHSESKTKSDVERVKALSQLTDWAANESLQATKLQAEQIYVDDVTGSKASEFPLQAITNKSAKSVGDNVVGQTGPSVKTASGETRGLTEAQRAAFRIFTGDDYGYINPATAVNLKWLNANKAQTGTKAAFEGTRVTANEAQMDKSRMSEGALHAGMLERAMNELPPYKGTVYRGMVVDQAMLDDLKKGVTFEAMTSTSTGEKTARDWARDRVTPEKPIELIYIIEKSGGRDVKEFSEYPREGEIMVAAGTRFTTTKIEQLPGTSKEGGDRYEFYLTGPGV
jgi:hypothetical protein